MGENDCLTYIVNILLLNRSSSIQRQNYLNSDCGSLVIPSLMYLLSSLVILLLLIIHIFHAHIFNIL